MIDYDFQYFESEFICPYCGGLLYLDGSNPPNDVCINKDCLLWPDGMNSLVNAQETEEPKLFRELHEQEEFIVDEIRRRTEKTYLLQPGRA